MDNITNNKILFGALLILSLWAPVFLARKLSELVRNKNRSAKNYAIILPVVIALTLFYVNVLDFSTRIMLGIPSLIILLAFIAVTYINKYRSQ